EHPASPRGVCLACVWRRLRRRVCVRVPLRAVAAALREPPRFHAVRVLPDRLWRVHPDHRVQRRCSVGLSGDASRPGKSRWIGPLCAVVGVFGFSFKAIILTLAFKSYPVHAVALLTFRMLYSAPLFCLMAWWASRAEGAAPIARGGWMRLVLPWV